MQRPESQRMMAQQGELAHAMPVKEKDVLVDCSTLA
jgi:hypothetical protein